MSTALPAAAPTLTRTLRVRLAGERTLLPFVLAVGAVNVSALLGNALALRWVDPASMGVWHTLLLASSYLTVVRLGVLSGLGRELPYALGCGDQKRARRIAATSLSYSVACSAIAGLGFVIALAGLWSSGATWRMGLAAMAVVSASTLYLSYLQATFRSDRDFMQLARIHWAQALSGALLPFAVAAWGFAGLCAHAAAQMSLVTAYAHAVRPLRVPARFEPRIAHELLATGMPLFLASYAQTLAMGFDRVILLQRAGVEAVGHYAPALAVLAAMAIVPGAISTYIYPRMSHALGEGRGKDAVRRTAFAGAGLSIVIGLPMVLGGWLATPSLIGRFFPQYEASIPAMRWSLLAGLAWSATPAAQLLGCLKAWGALRLYIGVVVVARWAFPWLLARAGDPLAGVAQGNLVAAVVSGAALLVLVRGPSVHASEEAAA